MNARVPHSQHTPRPSRPSRTAAPSAWRPTVADDEARARAAAMEALPDDPSIIARELDRPPPAIALALRRGYVLSARTEHPDGRSGPWFCRAAAPRAGDDAYFVGAGPTFHGAWGDLLGRLAERGFGSAGPGGAGGAGGPGGPGGEG